MVMKYYVGIALGIIIAFVMIAGGLLLWKARADLQTYTSAYQLVVVTTWADSFNAIVAALIAFIFGDKAARVWDNRNRLIHGHGKDLSKLGLYDL